MNVFQIAVLDVDICGPSIPKVMGIEGEQVRFAFGTLHLELVIKRDLSSYNTTLCESKL